MKWNSIDICFKCAAQLSSNDKMYSDGVCPYCGYDSKCSVCRTDKVIFQTLNKGTFFFPKKEYIGLNDFSKNWLKVHKKN